MASTCLPFLYQTRTILRARRLPLQAVSRSFHAAAPTCARNKSDAIPFEADLPGGRLPADGPRAPRPPRGTITPTERQTFDRIFADIAARGLKPKHELQPPDDAKRSVNRIIAAAAFESRQIRPSAITSPVAIAGAAKDRNKALFRFPPSLRAAASRALDIIEPSSSGTYSPAPDQYNELDALEEDDVDGEAEHQWRSPQNTFERAIELDAKRYPEQKRIEDMMNSAETDFELWDVMEKEVFTMPDRLGVRKQETDDEQTVDKGSKRSRQKKDEEQSAPQKPNTTAQKAENAAEVTGPPLDLYTFGPLYPYFILLGLRRLNTAFTQPSPLALSIMPRVKKLGLESYVLGASTPFYNELLDTYYHRYGDLAKMLDLLEEMRHSGLYFDENTSAVLGQVQNQTDRLAKGRFGGFAEVIMTMPEYERSMRDRIKHWHRQIDLSIGQRDADIDYPKLVGV